jgi:hypothetical protein
MKFLSGDHELMLEMGLVGVALGILGGLGVLVFGRLAGDTRRGARHAASPPSAGSVPPERHQHFSSSPR